MTFLTGKGIIDDALTIIKNNSTPVRGKMLGWLNITAGKLAMRPWLFLGNGTATLTPASNVLTLPADFGQVKSIKSGADFFMTPADKLSDEEAWESSTSVIGLPRGYTEGIVEVDTLGVITRHPIITLVGAPYTSDVVVNYIVEPAVITDSTSETSWPSKCRMVFLRSLLDFFYEYDMDERAAIGYQLNKSELYDLKKWDNTQKPKPQVTRQGYTRGK